MKIKVFALIGLLSILLLSGVACDVGGPTTYQLTTVVEGQGSITPSEGSFTSGEAVTLTASPASGWSFSHWGGQGSGSQNPISITMDSDKTVYAYFTEETAEPTQTSAALPTEQQPTATSAGSELIAPTLKAPKAGAIILQTKPLFQWSGIGWADKYQLQVATDSGFASAALVINENLGNVQAFEAPTELPYSTYYWRVKAMSDTSETEWSSMGVFTVAKEMPGGGVEPWVWGFIALAVIMLVLIMTLIIKTRATV